MSSSFTSGVVVNELFFSQVFGITQVPSDLNVVASVVEEFASSFSGVSDTSVPSCTFGV